MDAVVGGGVVVEAEQEISGTDPKFHRLGTREGTLTGHKGQSYR